MTNIIEITDFLAPELDVYARLTEGQLLHIHEPDPGIFIAESPKVIERALDAGCEPVSLLLEKKDVEGQAMEVVRRCGDIPVFTAEFDVLTKLTGFQLTRGVLCAMRRKPLPPAESVCAGARRVAVLENVMNPTNVGAIFRSAAALNMDAVLLTPGCADPLYRRAVRVSMGTVFQVPWTFFEKDPAGAEAQKAFDRPSGCPWSGLRLLRQLGFRTAAMALREDSIPIDDPGLMETEKLAIVLGTEGEGLADGTIAACDYTVRIPMSHGVDSLNVAAASAVAFWQLGRITPH